MNENKVSRRRALVFTGLSLIGASLLGSEMIKEVEQQTRAKENKEKLGTAQGFINKLRDNIDSGKAIEPTIDNKPTYISGSEPINYQPDENNLPLEGMEDVDLSGISLGEGFGSDSIDWSVIPPYTLRIPSVNLSMPWVPKGRTYRYTNEDGFAVYDINVPVSFQAGWSIDSQPITGKNGTSFFFAHTNWADVYGSPAPMSAIKLVEVGAKVYTSDGSGNVVPWIVSRKGITNKDLLDNELNVLDSTGSKRLVLCTCNKNSAGVYSDNYWVEAFPA